ncbi:hypothetical protein ACFQGX_00185 [Nonomuraea dietziae]|uniref:hypothetical protein n=1 Tax=Nonomuraea dietziae TaxID=65515 RepID=UPI0036185929
MDQITLSACAEVGFQVAGRKGAHGAMRALRRVIPLDAYEFVAFDPVTGRHTSLVSDGLTVAPAPSEPPLEAGRGPYAMEGAAGLLRMAAGADHAAAAGRGPLHGAAAPVGRRLPPRTRRRSWPRSHRRWPTSPT